MQGEGVADQLPFHMVVLPFMVLLPFMKGRTLRSLQMGTDVCVEGALPGR